MESDLYWPDAVLREFCDGPQMRVLSRDLARNDREVRQMRARASELCDDSADRAALRARIASVRHADQQRTRSEVAQSFFEAIDQVEGCEPGTAARLYAREHGVTTVKMFEEDAPRTTPWVTEIALMCGAPVFTPTVRRGMDMEELNAKYTLRAHREMVQVSVVTCRHQCGDVPSCCEMVQVAVVASSRREMIPPVAVATRTIPHGASGCPL